MWIKSYIFCIFWICLSASGLWAQSPYRIATFSSLSAEICKDFLGHLGESLVPSSIRHLRRSEPFSLGNDEARFGPFAIARSKETANYIPNPESGRVVHYIQILPGKLKFLRSKLTAEEVNILLNQIREIIIRSGLIENGESAAIFGFKSGRYNFNANQENSEEISKIIKASENIFRNLQKNIFESPHLKNGPFNWQLDRLLALGSGESEIEAVIASRFSTESFVKFSKVEAKVKEAILELRDLSSRLKNLLRSNVHTSSLIANDRFEKSFFDNFRQFQTQEDFIDNLRSKGLTEGEAEELAGVAFRFFALVDKFIPGTQFSNDSIEQVFEDETPRDRSPSKDTKTILIADVKGAGSDILSETWNSLEAAIAQNAALKNSSFNVKAVLGGIDISPAIQRLRSSLDRALETVKKIEGENLIDHWITGDEILFFLKAESKVHRVSSLELGNVRLVEENQSSVSELAPQDRAYFREVVERSHKFLEKQYPDLPLKMVRADFKNDLFSIQISLQNSADKGRPSDEQLEAIKIAISKDLREGFSDFQLLDRLQVDFFEN